MGPGALCDVLMGALMGPGVPVAVLWGRGSRWGFCGARLLGGWGGRVRRCPTRPYMAKKCARGGGRGRARLIQSRAALYHSVQSRAVPSKLIQSRAVPSDPVQSRAVPSSTVQSRAVPSNPIASRSPPLPPHSDPHVAPPLTLPTDPSAPPQLTPRPPFADPHPVAMLPPHR